MLQVVQNTNGIMTVQFNGADLKKWYACHGWTKIYICHVVKEILVEQHLIPKNSYAMAESRDLINALREAVPNRFTARPVRGSVVVNYLLRKYVSNAGGSGVRTRANLVNCVPDSFMFTVKLMLN
jgi:hypothetical protein